MLDVEGIMLAERFRELLDQEQQAGELCAALAGRLDDSDVRQQLEEIHRDKLRQVQMIERLLEIVE